MLRTLVLTLALLLSVGIASVYAEDEQKVEIKTDSVKGKIVKIDADNNSITIMDTVAGKNVTYVFNETTTFYRDGATIEVKTLVPDEMVTLSLDPEKKVIVRLDTPVVEIEEED